MKLKELFIKNQSYVNEIKINENYSLFCEGLDENGETINDEILDIDKVEYLCLEVFQNGDYICGLDSSYFTIETEINNLIECASKEIIKNG